MFNLILRPFLLIFIAKSVKSLQCYRTAEGACESITDRKDISKCLSDNYEKFTCESKDKACVHGYIIDKDGVRVDVRGCISDKSASKNTCEKELFVIVSKAFPESIRKETKCVACESDFCNENVEPHKHVSSVGSYKNVSYYAKLFACLALAVNALVVSI